MGYLQHSTFNIQYSSRRGQLLLEILIVIAATAIIVSVGVELVLVSLRSNKNAGDTSTALNLAAETLEGVRIAASEEWLDLYDLEHNATAYYATTTGNRWSIATGTEPVNMNGIEYSRSFTIQHVCRSTSTNSITGITDSAGNSTSSCTASGGEGDPSTEKITVSMSWTSGGPIATGEYITRWRNKACVQTGWTSATTSVDLCPEGTEYESKTDVDASTSLELCPGGC